MLRLIPASLLALIVLNPSLLAQDLQPCGTRTTPADLEWLRSYQSAPEAFPLPENDTLVAALQLFLLGNDNGSGFFSPLSTLNALCQLQQDFAEAGIVFVLADDIEYIANTAWNEHDDFDTGGQMIETLNRPNVINAYLSSGAAGNCGYYWMDAVVVAKGCAGNGDHTFAHEVGHFLSLPHPFVGWEGIEYDPAKPTSQYIGQVWTGIESVDDPNCNQVADGFCDTGPDYLSYRWGCNGQALSNTEQTDLNGQSFRSDGTLFMSYSFDACASRFSPEQIQAMRANLKYARPGILRNLEIQPIDPAGIELLQPVDTAVVPANYVRLEWKPVPGATHYLLQVGRHPFQSVILKTAILADTTFVLVDNEYIQPGKRYWWRIRPFGPGNYCTDFTERQIFEGGTLTSTAEPAALEEVQLGPSPLPIGTPLHIQLGSLPPQTAVTLTLLDLQGRVHRTQTLGTASGSSLSLSTAGLQPGLYLLQLSTGKERRVFKVVLTP